MSPALTGGFFTAEPPGKPRIRSGRRQKSKRDLQPQQEGERGRELFTRGRKTQERLRMLSWWKGETDPGSRRQANHASIPGQLPVFPPPSLATDLLLPVILAARSSKPASFIVPPPNAQTGSSVVPLHLLHHPSVPFPLSTTKGKFMVALGA